MHVLILTVILQFCLRLGNNELDAASVDYFNTIQNDKSYAQREKEEEAKILSISHEYNLDTTTKPTEKYDFTSIEANLMDDESSQTTKPYVRKGTNFDKKGRYSREIPNVYDIPEKREVIYEDEYSQETNTNIAKGFGTNMKKLKKKDKEENFDPGQPIISKKVEGRNEYNRLKKIGLRSQYSAVNDNSSVLGNQTHIDSPRRGVFYSNPAVKYGQDISFHSIATTASNSNRKGKFDALKEALKKVGKRRSSNYDFENNFVGGEEEEELMNFERSETNNDASKPKFKMPTKLEEIMRVEKDDFNDYPDYKGEQQLLNTPKSSITSSRTTTEIRHGRAPEPSTKTTPKPLTYIESSLLGPNILRQGPSDYKEFDIGPDQGIVPDAGLGEGIAPRGGLGKGFMPGVPDLIKNMSGRFNTITGGFHGPVGGNEKLRVMNGPSDSVGAQHSGPIGSKTGFLGGPGKSGFNFPGGNRPDMLRGLGSSQFGPGGGGGGRFGPGGGGGGQFRPGGGYQFGPGGGGQFGPGGGGQFGPGGRSQFGPGGGGQFGPDGGGEFGPGGGGQFDPGGRSQFGPGGGGQFGPDGGGDFGPRGGGPFGPDGGGEFGPRGGGPFGPDGEYGDYGPGGQGGGQFGLGGGGQFGPRGGGGGQFDPSRGRESQFEPVGGGQFSPGGGGHFGPGGGGNQFGPGGGGRGQFGPGSGGGILYGREGGGQYGDGRQFGPGSGGGGGSQLGPGPGGGGGNQLGPGPGGGGGSRFGPGLGGGVGSQLGPGSGGGSGNQLGPGPGGGGGSPLGPGPGGGVGSQLGPGPGGGSGNQLGPGPGSGGGSQLGPGPSGGGGSQFGPGFGDGSGSQLGPGPGGGGGSQLGPGLGGGGGSQLGPGPGGGVGSQLGPGPGGGGGSQFRPGFGDGGGSQLGPGPGGRGGSQLGPGLGGGGGSQLGPGPGGGVGRKLGPGPGGGGGNQLGPGPGSGGGSQLGPGSSGGGGSQFGPGFGGGGGSRFGPGPGGGGGRQLGPGSGGGGGSQLGSGPGGGGGSEFGPGSGGGGGSQFGPDSSGGGGSQLGPGLGGGGGSQFGPGFGGGGGSQLGPGPGGGGGRQLGPGSGGGGGSQLGPGPGGGGGSQFGPGPGGGGGSQLGPGPGGGGGIQFGPGPGGDGGSQLGPGPGGGGGSQFGPGPGGGDGSRLGPGPGGGGGSQFRPSSGGGGGSQLGPGPGGGGGSRFGPSSGGGGGSQLGPGPGGGGGSQLGPREGGGGSQLGPGPGGGGGSQLGPGPGGGGGSQSGPGPGGGGGSQSGPGPGGGGGSQLGPGPGGGDGNQLGPGGEGGTGWTTTQTTTRVPETTPKPIITEYFPEELSNVTAPAQTGTTTETDEVVLKKFMDEYVPVYEKPNGFRDNIKKKMTQNNEGYMSAFLISFFKMMATKSEEDVKIIKSYFQPIVESHYDEGNLFHFGEPIIQLVRDYVDHVGRKQPDIVTGEATLAHYAMTHRNDSISKDLNGLINYVDALYYEDEGEDIIEALYNLNQYPNQTRLYYDRISGKKKIKDIHTILKDLCKAVVIAPFKRLEGTLKRKILVEALNRYVVNRFLPEENIRIPEAERRNTVNESLKLLLKNNINKTVLERHASKRMNPKGNTFRTGDSVYDTSRFDKPIPQRNKFRNRKMIPKYYDYWQRDLNKQFSEHPKIYEKYISNSNKDKYDDEIKYTRNLYHKYEYLMDIQRKIKLLDNYPKLTYLNEYEKNKVNQRNRQKKHDLERKLKEKDTFDIDKHLLEENKEKNKKNGTTSKVIKSKRFRLVENQNEQKSKPERVTVENEFNGKPNINKMYFAKVAQNNKVFRHTTLFKNIKLQYDNDIKYSKRITKSPSAKIVLFKPGSLGRKIVSKYKKYLKKEQRKPGKDEIIKQITKLSSYSSEEDELKMNLRSALLHGNRKFLNPWREKFITNQRSNKKIDINLSSSGTDEEQVLKSKIYQYFG